MLCLTALMEKVVRFIIIHNVFALKKSANSRACIELCIHRRLEVFTAWASRVFLGYSYSVIISSNIEKS